MGSNSILFGTIFLGRGKLLIHSLMIHADICKNLFLSDILRPVETSPKLIQPHRGKCIQCMQQAGILLHLTIEISSDDSSCCLSISYADFIHVLTLVPSVICLP